MNRSIKLLSVVLLIQLVLVALVWSGASGPVQGKSTALVADPDQISRITLDDPEEGELTLIHADAGWRLSASGDEEDSQTDSAEPADEARVAALLGRLRALRTDYPVAHTAQARERFKVAKDDYRRKLLLTRANGDSTTLLVGTSPVMGESHLRLEGDDNILPGRVAPVRAVGGPSTLEKAGTAGRGTGERRGFRTRGGGAGRRRIFTFSGCRRMTIQGPGQTRALFHLGK